MWIINPLTYSLSAQAEAASISDLNSLFHMLEPSLMWRSKHMPAPSWERAWKRNIWLQHLCGRISKPSTADGGVDLWIAYLAATRANLSASPAAGAAPRTHDICGPTSAGPSTDARTSSSSLIIPSGCSSKMSPTICEWGSNRSPATYDAWATSLRRACLQRRKLAPATDANDCLSWRTPSDDLKRGGAANPEHRKAQGHTINLQDQATYWPTANVPNGGRAMAQDHVAAKGQTSKGKRQVDLGSVAAFWPSPRVSDENMDRRSDEAMQHEADRPNRGSNQWPTPSASDPRQGYQQRPEGMKSQQNQQGLTTIAVDTQCSLLGQPILETGGACLSSDLTSPPPSARGQLNPYFVEWLMGWPLGWTVCVSSVTEWSHYKQRMRSLLSAMRS